MKRLLAIVMMGFLLPVLASAEGQVFNNPIPLSSNTLNEARNLSANIESRVAPDSAKGKGLWAWVQEKAGAVAGYISRAIKSFNAFIGDKWGSFLAGSVFSKIVGILKSIVQAGWDFIREIFDYIRGNV